MSTTVIQLRTIEEQTNDFKPSYQPIYPLLMDNAQAYAEVVGEVNFTKMEVVGDVRSKRVTPKDTEIHEIQVGPTKKGFKKYFFGSQFVVSDLQDRSGLESVNSQVIDEHNKQMDELLTSGDGSANNNVRNNGLFYSADANYLTEASYEVKKGAALDHLVDLHNRINSTLAKVETLAGEKIVFLYGDVAKRFSYLYAATSQSFKDVLQKSVGDNVRFVKLPANATPAGHGFIIVSKDNVKLHYTSLPKIKSQGVNEEKGHVWTNFIMGSCMLEVLVKMGIIHQPVTWEV